MVSQEQICSGGDFPSRQAMVGTQKGGGGLEQKAARGSTEEAKAWVVGPWAKVVEGCLLQRGRAGPKQNRRRQDIETLPYPLPFLYRQ